MTIRLEWKMSDFALGSRGQLIAFLAMTIETKTKLFINYNKGYGRNGVRPSIKLQ